MKNPRHISATRTMTKILKNDEDFKNTPFLKYNSFFMQSKKSPALKTGPFN